MTIKEAYDWINTDSIAALFAGTTAEEWAEMSEEDRIAIAKEYADFVSEIAQ